MCGYSKVFHSSGGLKFSRASISVLSRAGVDAGERPNWSRDDRTRTPSPRSPSHWKRSSEKSSGKAEVIERKAKLDAEWLRQNDIAPRP